MESSPPTYLANPPDAGHSGHAPGQTEGVTNEAVATTQAEAVELDTISPAPAPAHHVSNKPAHDGGVSGIKPAPGTAVVPAVTPLHLLGGTDPRKPQHIDCPFCKKRTLTRTNKEGTSMQLIASVLCCLLCVCLVCVPQLAGWCENTNYTCTNCNHKVATVPDEGPVHVFGPVVAVPSQYPAAQKFA